MSEAVKPAIVHPITSETAWPRMRVEAQEEIDKEPMLASFLASTILNHETFCSAMSYRLAAKLADAEMNAMQWRQIATEAYNDDESIVDAALADIHAHYTRDPACHTLIQTLLYFKGFHALQSHRIAHWLMKKGRHSLAFYLQSRVSQLFGMDIHPAAPIGKGIFIDHGNGIVIGETAKVGDNVTFLQNVTLGGTGKEHEDRHPKIADGVLLGAGAKILGNILIGEGAKIAAGSVVLAPVKAHCTVAGVPAKPVGKCAGVPAEDMDQQI